MKRKIALLLVSLFLISQAAYSVEQTNTLVVSGAGSVSAKPDSATVRLGVEVLKKTALEAQSANATLMDSVIASIKKLGISKENIQTSSYNLSPEYSYEQGKTRTLIGYHSSNQLNILLEDIALIPKVIDSSVASGATTVQGISFDIINDKELKKAAMEKAVMNAKEKADILAKAAGIKIKGIQMISEGGAYVVPQYDNGLMRASFEGSPTPIMAGNMEIKASVSITYLIEN
jgi:uncharacterized protein